jgi:hypothetical protein
MKNPKNNVSEHNPSHWIAIDPAVASSPHLPPPEKLARTLNREASWDCASPLALSHRHPSRHCMELRTIVANPRLF